MTKALTSLHGCAGRSAPLLFPSPKYRFSCVEANFLSKLNFLEKSDFGFHCSLYFRQRCSLRSAKQFNGEILDGFTESY